jgi:hypothetical protein
MPASAQALANADQFLKNRHFFQTTHQYHCMNAANAAKQLHHQLRKLPALI